MLSAYVQHHLLWPLCFIAHMYARHSDHVRLPTLQSRAKINVLPLSAYREILGASGQGARTVEAHQAIDASTPIYRPLFG